MALSRRTGQRLQTSIWPGFVDAMTGLLLVLMFVLTIFMVVQAVLRDTITGQESELDTLGAEVAALAEALGLERRKTTALEDELGTLNATLDDTDARLERTEAMLIAANTEIASFQNQVAALLSQQQSNEAQIAQLMATRDELETTRDQLISEREALNLALATARSEIDVQLEAARLAAAQREAMEALIADLRSENADTTETAAALAARVEDLEATLSAEETAKLAEAAAAEALRARLQDANAELTAMTLALEQERQRAEETLTLLAAAREAEENLNARLAAALLAGEDQAAQLQFQLDQRNAELGEAREALRTAQNANASAESVTTELQEALSEERAARRFVESQLAELRLSTETEVTGLQASLAQAETTLRAAQEANASAEATVNQLRSELDEERTARQQAQTALARLREAQEADRSRLTALQASLAAALLRAQTAEADSGALAEQRADNTRLQAELQAAQDRETRRDAVIAGLRDELTQAQVALQDGTGAVQTLQEQLNQRGERISALEGTLAARDGNIARLQQDLADTRQALELAQAEVLALAAQSQDDTRSLEEKLAAALAAQLDANQTAEEVRDQLAAALAAKRAAEQARDRVLTEAEERAALLSTANTALNEEQSRSNEARREAEVLNQQVAALRRQLSSLQALLDDARARDAAANVQIQNLGQDLNTALARVAAEERKRRLLEEAERERLEAEKADLEKYRSEFFGRLRDLLGAQEGVRIEGDRFVFSSEVLFDAGEAELSRDGELEIAKIASILRSVSDEIPPEIDWVIRVDGHTDNIPVRPGAEFADNWELSQARALSVVLYMINFLGISPNRLAANGFGQYQPINPENTPEARAQNRRIELKFTER